MIQHTEFYIYSGKLHQQKHMDFFVLNPGVFCKPTETIHVNDQMVSTLYPIEIQIRGGGAPYVKKIYFEEAKQRDKWVQILTEVTGSYLISDFYRLDAATHILLYPNDKSIDDGELVAKNNLQDIKLDDFSWSRADGHTLILKGIHKKSLKEVDIKMTSKHDMTLYEMNELRNQNDILYLA